MASNLKRFARWLLGGVFVLSLVAVGIVVFGDLSQFRARVETAAARQLGREVSISGEMRLQPTLPLQISISDIVVENAAWATRAELARIGQLRLTLSMPALLRAEFVADAVEVVNFELNPEVNAHGARSWVETEGGPAFSALPGSIELRNGTMLFVDQGSQTERQLDVDYLDAYLDRDRTDVELVGSVGGQALNARLVAGPFENLLGTDSVWPFTISLDGPFWSVSADGERQMGGGWRAGVSAKVTDDEALSLLLGARAASLGLSAAEMTVSAKGEVVRVDDFRVQGDAIEANGVASFDRGLPRPVLTATLHIDSFDFDALASTAGDDVSVALAGLFDEPLAVLALADLDVDVDLGVDAASVDFAGHEVGPIRLRAALAQNSGHIAATATSLGGTFELAVDAAFPAERVRLEGSLTANGLDPTQLTSTRLASGGEDAVFELGFTTEGRTLRDVVENLDASLRVGHLLLNLPGGDDSGETAAIGEVSISIKEGVVQGLQADGHFRTVPIALSVDGHRSLLSLVDDQSADVRVSANLGGLELQMDGEIETPMTSPRLATALAWATDDLGALAPLLRMESASLYGSRGAAQLRIDASAWSLKLLEAQIGDSAFSGSFASAEQTDGQALAGTLHAERLHVGQLRRLGQLIRAGAGSSTAGGARTALLVDVEVEQFRGGLENVSALTTRLVFDNGTLRLQPLQAKWSGTPVAGLATLTTAGSKPGVHVELTGRDVELGALFERFTSTDGFSGRAGSLALEFDAVGTEPQAWMESASGKLTLERGTLRWSDGEHQLTLGDLQSIVVATADAPVVASLSAIYEEQPVELEVHLDSLDALRANEPVDLSLSLHSGAFRLDAEGSAKQPLSAEGVRLELTTEGSSFAWLHARGWSPDWLDGPFKGSATLKHREHTLVIDALALSLPQTDVSGELSLILPLDGTFHAMLHSSLVTVPDLFDRDTHADSADEDGYVIPALPLGNAVGESSTGQFSWKIDRLEMAASVFRDVQLDVDVDRGKLNISTSGVTDSTDGRYALTASVDPSQTPPATLRGSGASYDFGWVLPDTGTGKPSWPIDFDIELAGPGRTLDWFLGHATGEIHILAGKTEGAEFERWDLNLLSMMLPSMGEAPRDQLSCLVINADVVDGVASADGLVAETQSLVIAGGGKLDLRSEKLGFLLTAKPRDASLTGVSVPLRVGGTLAEPEFEPASDELVLKAGTLLLGVANPIAFIGSYVFSQVNKGNRCESALETAREKHGVSSSVEIESSGGLLQNGLFGFLKSDRERTESAAKSANQARE